MVKVTLTVNNVKYELDVPPTERLIDTLRYRLGLTSVKEGCGRGECGTCIVLVNGKPAHSCLNLTSRLDGAEITTLEGIAPPGKLHAIQVAFIETRGVQCGFCTPGFIMVTKALLDRNPDPDEKEIRKWLASVLCRCGSYPLYFEAVKRAAKYIREGKIYFDEREVREKYHLKVLAR
ncbi:(2Fe-2S)-binding protein [Thermogladius sp. 4427co]|uniref:(2Fe-2S)-binding protein n=1 Tax=Thermogladius sp. 4427co TaxID=3450718 RepID=UPI003F7A1348